jgi:putative ABC transport system permease protein
VTLLTGNNWTVPFERSDKRVPAGERPPDVGWQSASSGFFQAMGIAIRSGRTFNDTDRAADAPVAVIVSEAEIVGVVGNIRRAGLSDEPREDMYFPFDRTPSNAITLFIRTTGEPAAAVPELQRLLRGLEPSVVFTRARTMDAIAAESVASTKLTLWLLGMFAAIALALAAVGVYGVMSYAVRQRSREIGTRMALGATRSGIAWMIMRDSGVVICAGLLAGLIAGVLIARTMASMLFGIPAADPATVAGTAAVLAGTMLVACYVPARRAALVDPARTLAE